MSLPGHPADADNPFSAHRVRPGAIPFAFKPGQSLDALWQRLQRNGGRGQIVGPHGSGKSALVAAFVDWLNEVGPGAVLIELHDGQRGLPTPLARMPELHSGAVLFVDGYEQLGRWNRLQVRRDCRRHGLALVVTAHQSVGFPDLARSAAGLALAQRIVEGLQGERAVRVTAAEVGESFARNEGNLREMLFDLYDLYECRRRGGCASNGGTAV